MSNSLTVTAPDGLPFVDFEREFDAPVAALFAAHADPQKVAAWFGPRGYDVEVGEWDFTTGGRWHMTHIDGAQRYEFRGTFHTVRENDFAIQTFEFLGAPDIVSIETVRFVDLGEGRSKLVGHATYPSLEARDGMVESGMERGMAEGYERLDEALAAA